MEARRSSYVVHVVSLILGAITAHALFETPNAVGGGELMMVAIILLMVAFKVAIDFVLAKLQKRRDQGRLK